MCGFWTSLLSSSWVCFVPVTLALLMNFVFWGFIHHWCFKKVIFSESFTKHKIVIGAPMWAEFVGGWGHQGGLTHVSAHILCVYIQISTPFFSLFAAFRTSICCKPAQWNTQQINWKAFIVELQPYAVAALSSLLMAAIPSLFVPRLFRRCQGLNRAVHVWAPLNRAIL